MEWKNGTLRSMLKGNKEKVIFLFCSGLLLFVISLPNGKTTDSGLRAGTVEVVADVSGDDESTALKMPGRKLQRRRRVVLTRRSWSSGSENY